MSYPRLPSWIIAIIKGSENLTLTESTNSPLIECPWPTRPKETNTGVLMPHQVTPRAAVSTTQVCAHVFVLEGCNSVKRRDGSAIYKIKKLSLPLLFTNWIATTLLANFLGLATLVVVVTLAWKRVPYISHSGIKLDKDSCIISECLPPLGFGSEKHGSWRSQHCSGSQWRQSSHSPVCHHGLVRRTKSYRSDSWQSQCCCVDPTTC